MYQEFFGLSDIPFSIAPDPRYLYMSERHREALAHLVYGLNSDGAFILLTGDVGTGKTTVSRCLLEQIPADTRLALVLNPKVSALELLETICDELYGKHAPHAALPASQASIKVFIDIINHYLLEAHAQGRKTVILIEEAQNLDLDVLEQLRLLTNLETNEHKLLQIILLGQPELLDILERPELSQLAQRITARYHLTPLNEQEMAAYIEHRLAVAGSRQGIFSNRVLHRLYQLSRGIPRLVNVLCDRAMLGAYVQNRSQVDRRTLETAAREVFGERAMGALGRSSGRARGPLLALAAAVLLAVLAGVLLWTLEQHPLALPGAAEVVAAETDLPAEASPVEASSAETGASSRQLQWPDESARLRSNSLAFQALFQQWQLDYQPQTDGSPCFFAQTHGMGCYEDRSNLEKLRTLNRPVVLKLHDHLNRDYYATLTGLGRKVARIEMADTQQLVDIDSIYQHWGGEFTLLWRPPPAYKKPIAPGDQGEDVMWLSQQLQQLDQSAGLNQTTVYQRALVDRIKRFQLEQGLVADGIVGVHTLVRLNNKLGVAAPNLLDVKS